MATEWRNKRRERTLIEDSAAIVRDRERNRNIKAHRVRYSHSLASVGISDTTVYDATGAVIEVKPLRKPRAEAQRKRKHRIVVVPDPPRKREKLATDYIGGDSWNTAAVIDPNDHPRDGKHMERVESSLSAIDAMIAEFEARAAK